MPEIRILTIAFHNHAKLRRKVPGTISHCLPICPSGSNNLSYNLSHCSLKYLPSSPIPCHQRLSLACRSILLADAAHWVFGSSCEVLLEQPCFSSSQPHFQTIRIEFSNTVHMQSPQSGHALEVSASPRTLDLQDSFSPLLAAGKERARIPKSIPD